MYENHNELIRKIDTITHLTNILVEAILQNIIIML